MAISARAAGTWAAGTGTTRTVTIPVGSTAGDLMVMHLACKPYTAAPTVNQSWTVLGTHADGTVANGNGTGSVRGAVAYKVHTGAESNPVVTWGATSSPDIAVIVTFQKAASETWATPVTVFGNVNNSTAINAAVVSNPGVTAGDMCIAGIYTRDNSTITSPDFSQTGVTFGTRTEYPATAISTTTSNDMAGDSVYRLASSGTGSAAPVITATQAAAETGVLSFTRLRVSGDASVSAGHASATASSSAPRDRIAAAGASVAATGEASQASITRVDGVGHAAATAAAADLSVLVPAGPEVTESILGRMQLGSVSLADTILMDSAAPSVAAIAGTADAASSTVILGGVTEANAATGEAANATANAVDGIETTSATGAAYSVNQIYILCYSGGPSATGAAADVTTIQTANAQVATATVTAGNVATGAGARAATATAAAANVAGSLGAVAGASEATGAAANAGAAVASNTIVQPEAAGATGSALDALVATGAVSESAAATAAAWGVATALEALLEPAVGGGTAYDASITAQSNAQAATATATAWPVSVPVGTFATGEAYDASIALGAVAIDAPAVGTARNLTPQSADTSPGSGSASSGTLLGGASQPLL